MHSQIATTADPCPLDLASSLNFNRAAPPEHLPPNTNQPRKNGTSLFPSSLPDSAQTNIFSTTTSRPTNSAPNKSSSAYKPSTSARATRTRPRGSGRPTSTATPRPASSATRPYSATWPSPRTSPWPRSALSSSARWSSPWARRRRARTRLSLRLGRGQRLGGRAEDGTGAEEYKLWDENGKNCAGLHTGRLLESRGGRREGPRRRRRATPYDRSKMASVGSLRCEPGYTAGSCCQVPGSGWRAHPSSRLRRDRCRWGLRYGSQTARGVSSHLHSA